MSYIAIDWKEKPSYYADDNPSIPGQIEKGIFYETTPQLAHFEYGYQDGYGWRGTYQIMSGEPGAKGKVFWQKGKDGQDNYYTLILSYYGSRFTNEYRKQSLPNSFTTVVRQGNTYFVVTYTRFRYAPGQISPANKLSK